MGINGRTSLFALFSTLGLAGLVSLAGACSADAAGDGASSSGDGGADTPTGPKKPGDACVSDDECEGKCTGLKCAEPTTSDGKRSPSLGETDVDCGGPRAPACGVGLGCAADGDCTTSICGRQPDQRRCVIARSCGASGGPGGMTTCGKGEVGEDGAEHESCCTSLPLPVTAGRSLDRYEITAGRIREFISVLAEQNGGDPNVRAWAKAYAADHPASQLAWIEANFPGFLDVLPDTGDPSAPVPLMRHLGALPIDAMNRLDGCYVGAGSYGHPTYWQDPETLAIIEIQYAGMDPGVRKISREELDAKPANCMTPLMLATFCAWDGGELARTSDYWEVWGRETATIGASEIAKPWSTLLSVGEFNYRNGRPEAGECTPAGFPGCTIPAHRFYTFPTGIDPADDDTPSIGAPGRFFLDTTKLTAPDGRGWVDIAGNLLEAAWPETMISNTNPGRAVDVCDMSTTDTSGGGTPCSRSFPAAGQFPAETRYGIRRYAGELPQIPLMGYSFEGHAGYSDPYLRSATPDETKLVGYTLPATFQYGKVTGRCARPAR